MSNHNNDDFMNYVGYQLYGGGNDPAFRPMQTSNVPQLNINPKSVAFFIIMMAISMFAQAVGDSALYSSFFAIFFISFLAGLAFFLYVPWSMKNDRVELHDLRIVSAVVIFVYIAYDLFLNLGIIRIAVEAFAIRIFPLIYLFLVALCLIQKKPKQLTIWLALHAGAAIMMESLSFFEYSAHASVLQYIQFFSMYIAWIVLFAACTHPGWKRAGLIATIFIVIWTIPYIFRMYSLYAVIMYVFNAAWKIVLAFTMSRSHVLEEQQTGN